jgi:TP901 family phage tail tape measure protein
MRGFQAALRAGLKVSTENVTATVKVKPVLVTGFRRQLQTQIKAAVGVRPIVVPVAVRPVLVSTFQSQLRKAVTDRVAKAAAIPVPITPVAAGGGRGAVPPPPPTATGAAGGGAGGARGAAAAQTALATSTNKATAAINGQRGALIAHGSQMNRFSRGVAATGLSMFGLRGATLAATSAFLAGAAAVTLLGKGIGFAASFASQLSVFQAVTGATADEMLRVGQTAQELGRDLSLPGVTARDAADAMTELAKAGLSVDQAIAATRGTLQLAKAANIDFAQATELVAAAINAFNLSGARATEVVDTLANAANLAQGSIVDIGIAFQQAAAIGHQVGLTFQDTTLFITQLAKAGLTGSDAGTSLRTALIRLINPTEKNRDLFKQLGLEVRDASGNLRPEFFVDLGQALQGMSKAQRDAILAQIGGQDAVRALSILTRQNIQGLLDQRDALHESGTAQTVAQARMVGLVRAGANLQNTLEAIGLSLGQKVIPALTNFTNGLTNVITSISRSQFVTGTLANTAQAIANAFRSVGEAVRGLAPILGSVVSALNAFVAAVGPAAILAGATAFFVLSRAVKSVGTGMKALAIGESAGLLTRGFVALKASFEGIRVLAAASVISFVQASGTLAGLGNAAKTAGLGIRVGLASAVTGILGKFNVWVVAIAAVTAGLFFLATRESATERATRKLKDATDDLIGSLQKAAAEQQNLLSAQQVVRADEAAVAEKRRAKAVADAALANLKGTASLQERINAENRAKVAAQDFDLAEKQLLLDQEKFNEQQKVTNQARQNAIAGLDEEAARVNKIVTSRDELIRSLQAYLEVVKRGRDTIEIAAVESQILDEQRKKRQDIVKALRQQADAARAEATAESIETAERLDALARIAARLHDLTNFPTVVRLVLHARDVETGLRQALANARAIGDEGGARIIQGVIDGMDKKKQLLGTFFAGPIAQILLESAGQVGDAVGTTLAARLVNSVLGFLERNISAGIAGALSGVQRAVNQANTLLTGVSRAELSGKSLEDQKRIADEARRRADVALRRADEAVRRAEAGGGKTPKRDLERARKAQADALAVDQQAAAEQERIQGEIDARDQETARRHKEAQDRIAEQRRKADEKFQDTLAGAEARFAIRRARVTATESLVDDIDFFRDYRVFILTSIRQTLLTVHDLKLKVQILRTFRQALVDNDIAMKQALGQQKKNRAERQKEAFERRQESLDLDIRIAQDKENVNAEIAALEAKNRSIRKRIAETHATGLALKRYQAEIEDNNARIRELRKAKKKEGDEGKALAFEFLQAEQGFASTLLSNLLPTGTIAGTVGGGGIATPARARGAGVVIPPADFATAVHQRGQQAAVTAGAGRGATAGQMGTLITIARHQSALLSRLVAQRSHPEASTQRHTHNERTAGGV